MKALVNSAPGELAWTDWPKPEPKAGEVRIRAAACGICATDLEMVRGWERTSCPSIPGHEWAGSVDALGAGVDSSLVGCPCVGENVLGDGGEVGFEHPGGYGQYFVTDARNLYRLPEGFPLSTAALIEPLAVCVRGLRRMRLTGSEHKQAVLILGDGSIGLIMLLLLKAQGFDNISVVGGGGTRRALARQFGAVETLDYHETDDLAGAIRNLSVHPFPHVIEASGAPLAIQASIEVAASSGRILVLGDYAAARANFAWNYLLHRELELIGSNASAEAWPLAVDLAISGRVPLDALISHRMPASSGVEAFELVVKSRDVVKVILDWTTEN